MKTKLMITITITLFLASMLSMAFMAPVVAAPDSGLVGRWHFDEGAGNIAHDSSGYHNDGTVYGASWTSGRFGKALSFDGVDDYVEVPNSHSLDLDRVTLEAWIYVTTNTVGTIVRKGPTYSDRVYGLDIGYAGVRKLFGFVVLGSTSGPALTAYGSTSLATNMWHHVAMVYDGTKVRIYADGALDGESSTQTGMISDNLQPLRIGAYPGQFQGKIDEVRVWNQALVPVKFTQTGLDNTAQGTVVTVTDPVSLTYSELSHVVMVSSGATVGFDYMDTVLSSTAEKRFKLVSVTPPEPSAMVTGPTVVTGAYKAQYWITFAQSGLDDTATGTVVTIGIATKTKADLPLTDWFDSGTTYSYSDPVSSTVSGEEFKLTGVTGPSSPTVAPGTVTGTYVTQFQVTFSQSGVGADFTGTVVTIDGATYGVATLPQSFWWAKDSTHSFAFQSPLAVSADKKYVWTSTSGLSGLKSGSITVTESGSITGGYNTQYYLAVQTDPSGVVTIPGEGWYAESHSVTLTAPLMVGDQSLFVYWKVDNDPLQFQGSITMIMNSPHTATANYKAFLEEADQEISSLETMATNLYKAGKMGKAEYEYFVKALNKIGKDIDHAVKQFDRTRYGFDDRQKGFEDLRHSVMKLKSLIDRINDWSQKGKIPASDAASIMNELEKIRMKLVNKAWAEALAEKALALKAIADANAQGKDTAKAQEEISKIDQQLTQAIQNIAEGKFSQAIQHFKHAFTHSEHAVKKAYDNSWTTDYKDWIDELEEEDP